MRISQENQQLTKKAAQYHKLEQQIKELKLKQTILLEELVSAAEKLLEESGSSDSSVEFGIYKLTKVNRKGSVSYATLLKYVYPNTPKETIDQYRGEPSSYWKLS